MVHKSVKPSSCSSRRTTAYRQMVTGPGFGRDSMTTGPTTLLLLPHRLCFSPCEDFSQESGGRFRRSVQTRDTRRDSISLRVSRERSELVDLLIKIERECLAEQEYHRVTLQTQSALLARAGYQI
jgi:hypothetical protein